MSAATQERRALVAGATGIIGSAIAERLVARGWQVVCASRSGSAVAGAQSLAIDLLDADAATRALAGVAPFTHMFFAAYLHAPTRAQEVAPNLALLANTVNALLPMSPQLRKVILVTGAKFYGIHWSASKSPMRESDPRQMPPNFYYDQEDFLRQVQAGKRWHWCNLIPPFISGYAVGNPMNVVLAIGVYAALCKELGLPLRFPGSVAAYKGLHHLADTAQLAAAAEWASGSDAADNQTFNIANGDPSRWCNRWPGLAEYFGMALAEPKHLPLAEIMPAQEALWQQMIIKFDLRPTRLAGLVNWTWADYMLRMENDVILELGKGRRAGFHDCLDTEPVFLARLDQLRTNRVIP